MADALEELRGRHAADLPVHGGRSLSYVYDSGRESVNRDAAEAVALYAGSNGIDPSAFPSLLQMENELVGFACDLIDAPASAVGTVTSGGTESILLAVQAARDARPWVSRPTMVVPSTVHPSFLKAADYFRVEPVVVPVGEDYRADVGAMAAAMDERTVLVVVSAPSYAHGVVDPVAWVAAAAHAKGVPVHVDACIGGWVLAYAERLGRAHKPWTFSIEGVSSISMDLHKYGYTPKGASILLFRTPQERRPSYFASAQWPGYPMINTTTQSTRPGAPLAGAWTVVRGIGLDGYLELAEEALEAVDRIVAGVADIPGLEVVVAPDSTLLALRSDDSCDVFTVADEVNARGFYVATQLSWQGEPATLHLSVSAATLARVEEFLDVLRVATRAAVAAGPATVDEHVRRVLADLDPDRLGDVEFSALLEVAGLSGEDGVVELPPRMAPVNVLLDAATPRLREAVLAAYLDRLSRPVRGEVAVLSGPRQRQPADDRTESSV